MKKYILLILAVSVAFTACSKLKVIPEISPHLSEIHVMDLTDKNLSKMLVANNSQLVFTTLDGQIFRWNPENKIVDSLFNLTSNISPEIFSQNDYLIFKLLKPAKYSIIKLDEMKEIAALDHINIQRILGLDHEILVYLADDQIHIYNYRSKRLLKTLRIGKRKTFYVYNCEFRGNNLFILSSRYFYIYEKSRDVVERIELKHLATSDFLLDDNVMYYGSEQRYLVTFSVTSRKIHWTFKMAENLKVKPQKIGQYIVIMPEDNNIYFFKKNGTLYWWERLNSTRLLPPVAMKENIAVFLWDQKIKFFNYKKKQVTTYPLNRKVKTNPVCIGDYIYVVTEDKVNVGRSGEEELYFLHLSKIGNHYGVEVFTEPRYVKPMGKSIRFSLGIINLVKAQLKIKIFKNTPGSESPIYEKTFTPDDKPSFIWIPPEAVEYRLIIEADAENQTGLTVEETFTALDVQKMLQHYYYQLQNQSSTNWLN